MTPFFPFFLFAISISEHLPIQTFLADPKDNPAAKERTVDGQFVLLDDWEQKSPIQDYHKVLETISVLKESASSPGIKKDKFALTFSPYDDVKNVDVEFRFRPTNRNYLPLISNSSSSNPDDKDDLSSDNINIDKLEWSLFDVKILFPDWMNATDLDYACGELFNDAMGKWRDIDPKLLRRLLLHGHSEYPYPKALSLSIIWDSEPINNRDDIAQKRYTSMTAEKMAENAFMNRPAGSIHEKGLVDGYFLGYDGGSPEPTERESRRRR